MLLDPHVYQALAVASGLRLFAQTKIRANRQWTPANMMSTATRITGKQFKPRDYLAAADALQEWAHQRKKDLK